MQKLKKVVETDEKIQYRVWMHKETAQLGVGLPGTLLGCLWFFAPNDENEVLNERFCNFLDDPNDPLSISSDMMIDLGEL